MWTGDHCIWCTLFLPSISHTVNSLFDILPTFLSLGEATWPTANGNNSKNCTWHLWSHLFHGWKPRISYKGKRGMTCYAMVWETVWCQNPDAISKLAFIHGNSLIFQVSQWLETNINLHFISAEQRYLRYSFACFLIGKALVSALCSSLEVTWGYVGS